MALKGWFFDARGWDDLEYLVLGAFGLAPLYHGDPLGMHRWFSSSAFGRGCLVGTTTGLDRIHC